MIRTLRSPTRWSHWRAGRRAGLSAQLANVPGAGHGLPADKPGLFNLLVGDFAEVSR